MNMSKEMAPTYEKIMARSKDLADKHADKVAFREIGPSSEGRPIPLLELGDIHRDLPLMMITGGTHGSEETGRAASMAFAEWLAGDPILDKLSAVVVPCVNPDGSIRNTYHNAQDQNIYKSYGFLKKSTTPEGEAVETVALELLPDCYADVHGLAGGAMGGSEYVTPCLGSNMMHQIGLEIAVEMDREAVKAGIPQRHPQCHHGEFMNPAGALTDKLSSETNALCFTVEITENYYPLEDSVTSGLVRLKKLAETGTRIHYGQPYSGFPCDTIVGGPMFAAMAFGATYKERRVSRHQFMTAILEDQSALKRAAADPDHTAVLEMEFGPNTKTLPKGAVFQCALDPRVKVETVNLEWPDGNKRTLTEESYTVTKGEHYQVVRIIIPDRFLTGSNRVKIKYRAPFSR
jgi:hypothetical protein